VSHSTTSPTWSPKEHAQKDKTKEARAGRKTVHIQFYKIINMAELPGAQSKSETTHKIL
jgi:hypothetical protein